jgi:regulatory protein YycH of two-component signal transduction system YycFG
MEIKEISRSKFNLPSESERAASKAKMEKLRKEGDKTIKGMFEFIDAQGGWIDFSYRFFPNEPIRTIKIYHGEIVDLPMILVKHLNNIWVKVRQLPENLDTGRATVSRRSRTRFTPMDVL